jgi:hypothetical protein
MLATRVWAWKRRLHRVPRGRGRAVADASRAAMPRTCTAAMSCSYTGAAANSASASMSRSYTGTAANSASGAAANSATCSCACSATSAAATSAAATSAATTAAASATTAVSEQWAGRCEQQCRYADYCKKLGHPHHDALLIRVQPGPTILPLSFKIGAHMVFHANCCRTLRR